MFALELKNKVKRYSSIEISKETACTNGLYQQILSSFFRLDVWMCVIKTLIDRLTKEYW